MLVDKIIVDLQKVVDWSTQGVITSAYIKINLLPVLEAKIRQRWFDQYILSLYWQRMITCSDIANELNAVKLGFASVNVAELGSLNYPCDFELM